MSRNSPTGFDGGRAGDGLPGEGLFDEGLLDEGLFGEGLGARAMRCVRALR
ncbi:MAG: hypothetical protein AB7F51_12955 [Pseudorhodoplanes sp.]